MRAAGKSFDLVIRGGTVVLPDGPSSVEIGVLDGRIAGLGRALPGGTTEIDADGQIVLPGGIDSHCHMDQQPWEGRASADDFRTGTLSAMCGGTTTVIPFAMQMRSQSLQAIVEDYHERAINKAHIDYAFHLIVGDPTPDVLEQQIPRLIAEGCTSIKIYLTYEGLKLDDYEMLKVLEVARREGAMVMVHAENDGCIRWLTERLLEQRKTALKYHVVSHPDIGDREATFRAISLSELAETAILIAHVAAGGAVEEIRRAKLRGLPVFAETCPQYLFLSSEDIDTKDLSGTKFVCTPPPRGRDNQETIWQALIDGSLDIFTSDHSAVKYIDKISAGPDTPFNKVPLGVPGIETRLPLLFSAGVNGKRMSLAQFAQVTATRAAQLFGLFPKKGVIALGSDADIAIWDPNKVVTITNKILHHATDYTPYEGMEVRGWPITTISRGEIVYQNGVVMSNAGRGRFISRQRPRPPHIGAIAALQV
jgi:dihydropyrimidinase